MYSLYSVSTNKFPRRLSMGLSLKGKNTGEIYKVICIIISDSVTIASSSTVYTSGSQTGVLVSFVTL